MGDPVGWIATIVNAILFFFVSIYILISKREHNISHYLFFAMNISLFAYSVGEAIKFTDNYSTAIAISKLSPALLSLALYFFTLFTYYLKNGWHRYFALLLFIPIAISMLLSPYMIQDIRQSIYGWVSIFKMPALGIYYAILGSYLVFSIINLIVVYRSIDSVFRRKILYLIIGNVTVLIFSFLYTLEIIEKEYLLPFMNLSFLILGFIYFYILIAPD